ncbi:MAG: glycosyltransferase [Bacteroidaceae bacterium]|nr:glycosyltransferase [Bacteroidaceae bacterium]
MAELSVVIPVYESAATLQRCVDSVLAENIPGIEVILVDDGSTDGGGQLCDSLSSRPGVTAIHRQNGGLSAARNTGTDAATGRWITFVDSDDEVAPGSLSDNLQWLEQNPETDMLEYPVMVHVGAPDCFTLHFEPHTVSGSDIYRRWIADRGYRHCYACNKIYRKSLFDGLRFPEGETFEDAAVCPLAIRRCSTVRYSDNGMYMYRSTPGSITRSYTFKGQEPLFRHNLKLLEDAAAMDMPHSRADLWSICLNLLIDLHRCSGTDCAYTSNAASDLARLKPSCRQVISADMPFKAKLKTLFGITAGPAAVCRLLGRRKYDS